MRIGLAVLQAAVAASARTVRPSLAAHNFSGAAMALTNGREVMQVKKLSDNAIMPVRGSEHAAGFDLARYARIKDTFDLMLLQFFGA